MRFVLVALMLSCTVAKADECTIPTDDQLRKMNTVNLWKVYKLTQKAMNIVAQATAMRLPVPECAAKIALKSEVVYQELRFR